jgi:crotonobetainyl-CoA:carnitine CoA-transferase CaiB-like acyl-CoA transferase
MCNKEKFWPVLCNCIGHPEWSNDSRFATFSDRLSNRDLITELLDEVLSTKITAEWMTIFAGAVPAAPVNNVAQALNSEFLKTTGQVIQYKTSNGLHIRSIGTGVRQPNNKPRAETAPSLAADQTEIFGELGYTPEEAEALAQGTV